MIHFGSSSSPELFRAALPSADVACCSASHARIYESRSPDGDGPLQYEQGPVGRLVDGRDTPTGEAPNLLCAVAARIETVRKGAGSEPADSHQLVLLRGPLDVIGAREEADRRLTALVDAIAAYLGGVD